MKSTGTATPRVGQWDYSANRVFEVGASVRLSEQALASRSPVEAKRYAGRMGVVSGYRMGACDPIVEFPQQGRRKALKVFELRTTDLERVPGA